MMRFPQLARATLSLIMLLGLRHPVAAQEVSECTGDCNSTSLSTAGPRGVAIADWDDDGKLDLISANAGSGSVSIVLQK